MSVSLSTELDEDKELIDAGTPNLKDTDISKLSICFAPRFDGFYQDMLSEYLRKLGINVEEISPRIRFLPFEVIRLRVSLVHLHWLDTFFGSPKLFKPPTLEYLGLIISLSRLASFITGLAILKLMGIKIIWTAHNLKNHENISPLLDRACTTCVVNLADGIIAHCEAAKQEVIQEFNLKKVSQAEKIHIIPHGNYISFYENKIERAEARRALEIANTSIVFLLLGNIRPYKGVFELIHAFKESENIKFMPGFVPDEKVQVYMNASDVVLFPYRQVLTSGSAILAMSFSKVCIAPRIGCLGEILVDNIGAFLYDPDIKEGLSQAMNRAIEHQDNFSIMGNYNRKVVAQWSWNFVANETQAVYQKYLNHKL
jgi:beta-1,4-mannosyltransferase